MRAMLQQAMLVCGLLMTVPGAVADPGAGPSHAHPDAVDLLGVPGVQQVGGQAYHLAFVGPRAANGFVLQEYLPKGQELGSYTDMLLLNHLPTDASPLQFAQDQLERVRQRRTAGDTLANGELLQGRDGTAVLDFLMSTILPDGRLVVEWNAYHYRRQAGGIAMTALSRRAYGEQDADAFLRGLSARRHGDRERLLAWSPQVRLSP